MKLPVANLLKWAIGVVAVLAIGVAVWNLRALGSDLFVETIAVEGTPVTVFRNATVRPTPVILIAHGFAGSQQLMRPFALMLARRGYVAVTFDFAGHGRNTKPLTGSITTEDGATRTLVEETARVAAKARTLGDGRVAVLGHSMATDIIVRFAKGDADVAATIAVSMFSPAVVATSPRNLLVIVGDWETGLKMEALRAAGLASAPRPPEPGVTYGDIAAGTARRVAFIPHTEHLSVLYSTESLREAIAWLDATFGVMNRPPGNVESPGLSILLLLLGVVALAYPLSTLLPVVTAKPAGAGLGWRRIWPALVLPAILTPIAMRIVPTHFLPVLVGDYLAVHFAAYGLITIACLAWIERGHVKPRQPLALGRLVVGAAAMTAFSFVAICWPADAYITSFVPRGPRIWLVLALLAGTLCYFLSDEWLTRGQDSARGGFAASKLAFLVSLAIAVALDFQGLFFLLIILPVILLFFVVYGLFSMWAYRTARHPFVAGLANAVSFAWAIGVTFPLLAGVAGIAVSRILPDKDCRLPGQIAA